MPDREGLTAAEAEARLLQYGPNAVPEEHPHPWRALLGKFWSPVPWMLEATIVLELAMGKVDEALVIGILLVVNALLSFFQEGRANRALALLRQRLSVTARVLRDGRWQTVAARPDLVPCRSAMSGAGRAKWAAWICRPDRQAPWLRPLPPASAKYPTSPTTGR